LHDGLSSSTGRDERDGDRSEGDVMVDFKGLAAKAKQFARSNPDKVNKVLDQAGSLVDKRTGRKYERHVDTVQQRARDFLGGTPRPPAGSTEAEGGPGSAGTDVPRTDLPGTDRPGPGGPDQGPRR
jgi:hypothetical protein